MLRSFFTHSTSPIAIIFILIIVLDTKKEKEKKRVCFFMVEKVN